MEVCFVDVGQGTSNVILLGGRRAIVIDCGGKQAKTVLAVLRHFRINLISRLIVTHAHDDHSGGAASILTDYRRRIEDVWMFEDVCRSSSLFWQRVRDELEAETLDRRRVRMLVREDNPKEIYREGDVLLSLIAPDAVTNFQAVDDRDPNYTSAVLVLKRGKQQILFAGDSTIAEWRDIFARRTRPFRCGLITAPHHAGGIWQRQQDGKTSHAFQARLQSERDWLYQNAIRTDHAIVSVGTNNQHRHPLPEVIAAMRRAGITPICTQMTRQCATDLEAQRRRSLPLVLPSRSVLREDVNKNGRSRNVPCAATILIELRDNGIEIQRYADHQAMIDRLQNQHGGTALCRN